MILTFLGAKMAKKKVKNRIVSNDRVFNMDVVEYWSSGIKRMNHDSDSVVAQGRVLYYAGGNLAIAYRALDGKMLVNGDEFGYDDDREDIIQKLQKTYGANTTSFNCLFEAGVRIGDHIDLEILDSHDDLNKIFKKGNKQFKDLEKNVPRGATLRIHRNYQKKTGKYTGAVWAKSLHRAGATLLKLGDRTFIASIDEDNYYVIECCKPVKTLVKAFRDLKPSKVRSWEKKNKTEAIRQGEWYFIPAPKSVKMREANSFADTALPMKSTDSKPHICSWIEEIKGRQYVSGYVHHDDHDTVMLGNDIYEALENTAVGSWSIEGVD
jgi:hypothetical protein